MRSIDRRVLFVCALAVVLGIAAAFVAQFLIGLIALITNLAYFGEVSLEFRVAGRCDPAAGAGGRFRFRSSGASSWG